MQFSFFLLLPLLTFFVWLLPPTPPPLAAVSPLSFCCLATGPLSCLSPLVHLFPKDAADAYRREHVCAVCNLPLDQQKGRQNGSTGLDGTGGSEKVHDERWAILPTLLIRNLATPNIIPTVTQNLFLAQTVIVALSLPPDPCLSLTKGAVAGRQHHAQAVCRRGRSTRQRGGGGGDGNGVGDEAYSRQHKPLRRVHKCVPSLGGGGGGDRGRPGRSQ